MPIYKGNVEIDKVYKGADELDNIQLGTQQQWIGIIVTPNPTITVLTQRQTSIDVRLTNTHSEPVTIFYEANDTTPDAFSVSVAANSTQDVTLSNLSIGSPQTIYAYALQEAQLPSTVVSLVTATLAQVAPTISSVSTTSSGITFRVTNNNAETSVVRARLNANPLSSSTPSVTLASGAISGNLTISSLAEGTVYSLRAASFINNISSLVSSTNVTTKSIVPNWDTSFTQLTTLNPPGNSAWGVAFQNDWLTAVTFDFNGQLFAYSRSGDTFTRNTNLPTGGVGAAFSTAIDKTQTRFAFSGFTAPHIISYTRSGSTFTQNPTPAITPSGRARAVALSSNGTYMCVGHESGNMSIYKFVNGTYVKLANPTTMPPGEVQGAAFSNNDTYLTVGYVGSGGFYIYKRSGDTFTKLADPSVMVGFTSRSVAFSSDDVYMAVSNNLNGANGLFIYKRNGDTFTKLADPTGGVPTSGDKYSISFTPKANYVAIVGSNAPYLYVYKRNGDSFARINDPSIMPNNWTQGAAFNTTGQYLLIGQNFSGGITVRVYKTTLSEI